MVAVRWLTVQARSAEISRLLCRGDMFFSWIGVGRRREFHQGERRERNEAERERIKGIPKPTLSIRQTNSYALLRPS